MAHLRPAYFDSLTGRKQTPMKTLAALTLALVAAQPALAVAPVLGSASFGAAPFTASATPAPAATPAPQADPLGSQAAFGWRTFGLDAFADPRELGQRLDLRGGH